MPRARSGAASIGASSRMKWGGKEFDPIFLMGSRNQIRKYDINVTDGSMAERVLGHDPYISQ